MPTQQADHKTRNKVITFGEIMLRLSPPNSKRLTQTDTFDIAIGGGEYNVAASLANYKIPVSHVTRIPNNEIAQMVVSEMGKRRVCADHVLYGGDRLGIYFLEKGAVHRNSKVTYDRANSGMETIQPGMVDWEEVFKGVQWFHWSGITPALSQSAADACMEAITAAKKMGVTISVDLNYRGKLWNYGKASHEIMPPMVALCDIILGGKNDAEQYFNLTVDEGNNNDQPLCEQVLSAIKGRFPKAKKVITNLRTVHNASHNSFSGCLYDGKKFWYAPTYDITHIEDRVGTGDAFMGGLIYSFLEDDENCQKSIDFATAAGTLKHTVAGDINLCSKEEVIELMNGNNKLISR